jgi:alkanesulfonate monooxygenase SsuD/methylene tetrahydromethanopterin reductase-like flavin-dependent oxidoreductase (luciferase family)
MTDVDAPRFRLGFLTHVQGRDDDPAAIYRNAVELFVAADELGFDVGWVAQHHAPLGTKPSDATSNPPDIRRFAGGSWSPRTTIPRAGSARPPWTRCWP